MSKIYYRDLTNMANIISLSRTMDSSGPAIYYTTQFRNVLEYHLPSLLELESNRPITIEPRLSLKYEGDLFGLLNSLSIPQYLHWITMRMNGYYSPMEYEVTRSILITPEPSVIETIKDMENTITKVV